MSEQPNICVRYRRKKYNRWVGIWDQWKPLELWDKPWQYWKGNMNISGSFWRGLRSNICIWSPLFNKLVNWKYRNMHLEVPYTTKDTLCVIKGGKNPKAYKE